MLLASTTPFVEQGGSVVVEAEHYGAAVARGGAAWTATSAISGFAGTGAMAATPNTGLQFDTNYTTTSPELRYEIQFNTPGVYRVWLRAHVTSGTDNSAHVGLDGQAVASSDRMSALSSSAWKWFDSTSDGPIATLTIASAGVHTINVWMREDGFVLDRILLTTSATLTPSGVGPAESGAGGVVQPQPVGNASLDPEVDPPWNIRRLTASGERAAWSPDGTKIAYVDKSFGNAYEVNVATGATRLLTGFFAHKGFLRVDYLASGDFLLTGARTFTTAEATRYHDEELWVLPSDLSHAPLALNQKVNEGTAISHLQANHIAWTETSGQYPTRYPNGGTALLTGDIVYQNGVPSLIHREQVYFSTNYIDVQDFRANDHELVFTKYITGRAAVYGVELDTQKLTAYRDVSGEYNEAEGVTPDGSAVIVESSRDQGAGHQSNQYIDLWQLSLDGDGKPFRRLTRWGDHPGYKASNPVVSPDGRYVAFQSARSGETSGIGHGVFLLDLAAEPASSKTIYSDGFDSLGGWTVATSSSDGSKMNVTSTGGSAVIAKSMDGQMGTASITRTIDTSGFKNISLNLTAFQSAATFELADKLKIEIDTGAGFERLLTDAQLYQGIDSASGEGVAQVNGSTSPASTGWLALQSSAADNHAVRLRITGSISAADEKYFLDLLQVRGVAIA